MSNAHLYRTALDMCDDVVGEVSMSRIRSGAASAPEGRGGGPAPAALAGRRILVVEDEMLLALDLEEGLNRAGCEVVGPVGSLRKALALAETEQLDAAILDVNLGGEPVFPLAFHLAEKDVPFVFATAYAGADEIYPPRLRRIPRIAKPYTISQALGQIRLLIAGRGV